MGEDARARADLGRDWDHVAARRPAVAAIDQDLFGDLLLLHALVRSPAPVVGFVARFESRLMSEPASRPVGSLATPSRSRNGHACAVSERWTPLTLRPRRGWAVSPAVTAVAVVLVLVAVAGQEHAVGRLLVSRRR